MIPAALVGIAWAWEYLITVGAGYTFNNALLWKYVAGEAYNLENASEALFVVFTRFLFAFVITWGLFALLATIGNYVDDKVFHRQPKS